MQFLIHLFCNLQLQIRVDDLMLADGFQFCKGGVLHDGLGENQTIAFAVLGDIGEFVLNGALDGIQLDFLPVYLEFSADIAPVTLSEEAHGKFSTPRSHQSADADDFAPMQFEIDIFTDFHPLVYGVISGPMFYFKTNWTDFGIPFGESVAHIPANHGFDDLILIEGFQGFVHGRNYFTITDDGDAIGNIGDFVELMGDENAGHSPLFELQQQIKQLLGLRIVQGCSRLVQDEDLDILCQSLGNLNELLFSHPDILDGGLARLFKSNQGKQLIGTAVCLVPVYGKDSALLVSQEHVLGNGEVGNECQLLMDDDDSLFLAFLDGVELARFSMH
ncbi:hypothetical protein DSECCO2_460710 [anaerobic digester metagenome]